MNDTNRLPYPEWQTPLQELILEFDRGKLREKALKVEALIFERQQQLARSSDGHVEREALHDALTIIRVLTERAINC